VARGKDLGLKYDIGEMFILLVPMLAQMSLSEHSGKGLPVMNRLMEAMFNTCQDIQQQLEGTQAPALSYVLWITYAFASSDVNDEVVKRWKRYSGYTKVRSLIQKLDNLWNENSQRKSIAKQVAWESVKGKFR
jgi:hypothetical protein